MIHLKLKKFQNPFLRTSYNSKHVHGLNTERFTYSANFMVFEIYMYCVFGLISHATGQHDTLTTHPSKYKQDYKHNRDLVRDFGSWLHIFKCRRFSLMTETLHGTDTAVAQAAVRWTEAPRVR